MSSTGITFFPTHQLSRDILFSAFQLSEFVSTGGKFVAFRINRTIRDESQRAHDKFKSRLLPSFAGKSNLGTMKELNVLHVKSMKFFYYIW
jgi:hypothetical protein